MCDIVSRSGADYIKTSTGFSKGGKTLQLAALGGKKVQVFASDIRQDVLAQLKKRMLAAKFKNIVITTPLGGALGEYDGVLVDAPCSASGRWRRNPEMRWIFKQEDLPKLTRTQSRLS